MKNINLVKGMLALLVVQLVSVSTLFAADSAHLNSGNTRGVPIDKVDIHLVFSEQTDTSVKVTWLPVPTTTEYLMKIDGGADLNLGTATEYVITRTTPGIFTVKVAAWKIGGTNELLGESEVVQTTTVLKAPGYAISWDETNSISTSLTAPKRVISGNTDFTVEFWVKAEAIETGIFNITTAGGFSMKIEDDGDLQIYDGTDLFNPVASATAIIDLKDPANPPVVAPPPAFPPVTPPHIRASNESSWQHIAIVYQNLVGYTIYKDGEIFTALTPTTVPSSTWNDFKIDNIKGQLDELRVWSVARSASQIQTTAFSTVPTASTSLKLYYRFDQPAGASVVVDLSGHGFGSDINKGAVAEVVVPSYAMLRPIGLATYKTTPTATTVSVYWKDSTLKTLVPRVDSTKTIYTIYVSETAGDYTTLVGGGPFVIQTTLGATVLSHTFAANELDSTKTYYMKIAMEDELTYTPSNFKAVQSAYSIELIYDPAVTVVPASYDGPVNAALFKSDATYAFASSNPASNLGSADFTVEAWFKSSKTTGVILASKNSLSSVDTGWDISLSGGVPVMNMSDGTTQTSVPAGNTAVQLNQWNHIAFVRQNGVVTPYLNTIARSTVSSNLDLSWPGGLSFGNYNSYDVAKSFIGELDEVRIFSSSRTAAEINAHSIIPASVNVTAPSFSLVAYYKCNRDNLAILTDEFGASAVLTGDISSSKTQSEAMGCPMAQLATAEALDSFEANWLKPTVITSDATQYTIEYANNPLFSNTGALTSTEVDENDFNVEKFEVDSLPFTQSAYFYQVSTIYDLGVDTNGDGNINDDDLLKRFSKMTALQLEMKMPIPKNAYTQSGTSTLSSDGVSEIHAAVGTALTTSLWFKANVRSNGTDLKDLLRITDTKNTQNRLKIHLDNERIKIQTDNPTEVDNGVVTMEPQRWYALTVVWESTGATVYLDGDVLYSTTVVTLSPGVIDATYVLESDFVGSLDDLKIWNRAFTQQEVKDYMNFEILNPSSHSDLIAYYDFNVARGPYLADLSQNGASLEVTDTGAFEPSYALGCPFALPFEDIDYNKFTVAWNESVDWAIGPVDGTIQTYAYDLDFTSKSPIGTERDAEVINVVANPDGLGKLLYLVTSMETSESEKVALDPTHEYACTINRSIVNPFSGLPEVRHSRNVSSRLRAEAPGECLNLLGSNDHLTLPTTLAGLGTDFTIETWVKFGPPASEPKFSIEISGTNFATRVTSPTTRTFIFDGTADGSPFLGMEWLINDVKYDEYVQDVFDDIEGDHLTGVKYFDLNGNDDPTGSFIKSRSPIDRSDLLMEVVNGTVADDQFGYKDQVALGGRIVAGFKNAANNALSVTNGLLQDFDRELGEDKNGDLSGEVLGHASKHARWFNLVMTYSGNTLKLYVDGFDADLSADPHGTYDPAQTVTRLGEGFNGFIEEFRIWDVAHSFDVLKAQRYSELDIQGVELLDPAEKAAAEAKRIERNGLTDLQYGHLTCYLPFSVSHRSGLANIKNIGSAVGDATLVNGESNALISTLENTVCWPLVDNHGEIIIDPVDGFSSASCRFFPCVRMSYNVRTFNGATTLPDEDNNPSLIKSGMNLTDGNLIPPNSVYTYRTDVNPHQTTHIEGKDIPTRYLSVMWGLADPSLVSKQVTQQSWYLDNSGLPLTENVILPDEDGNPTTYAIPITYEITFDMKAISPEVYDESYTGPNTSGMTDEEKKNVREKFDNLVDSDFQLLWCADDGPIRTSSDVYTDLNALFPVQDPLEPHYTKAQITVSKIGSEGTRAGTAFTVKFSGIPRDIRYSSFDRNLNVKAWNHHHAGYYALGMSVSINDMVLTPVTGLVSDIVVVDGVATVSWSVVTESNVKQYLLEKRGKDGKWHTVSVVNSDGSLNYSLQDPDHAPGDEYRITTIDVNGMRQAFPIGSDALSTAYVTLNTGWNLISFPLNNVDLSDMRDLTVGKYWNWDGSSYQELNDTPKAMEGVWVYSLVNNFPVKVTGVETDQDYLDLTTGWNLKGPRENTYFDDKAITVYTWSNQNQYVKISEAINQITSGHGYWIFNPDLGKQIPLHDLPLN